MAAPAPIPFAADTIPFDLIGTVADDRLMVRNLPN